MNKIDQSQLDNIAAHYFKDTPHKQYQSVINVIIYTRVSTAEQVDNNSLNTQKKQCVEFCKKNNYNIVDYFGGTYESAKTDSRKELDRLMQYVSKMNRKSQIGKISFIVVYHLDRFSRTGLGAAALEEEMQRKFGVSVLSVSNPVDTSTPAGRFMQSLGYAQARLDNDLRGNRSVEGMQQSLLNGYWPSKPPIGYDKSADTKKRRICVLNTKGELLRKAFKLKIHKGYTNSKIQKWLESRGLVLRMQTLNDIFKNPFYAGLIKHNLIKGKIVQGNHEAIISIDEFEVLEGINKPWLKGKQIIEDDRFPLKGTLCCATCGTKLTAYKASKKNAQYYKCNTKGCGVNKNIESLHSLFLEECGKYTLAQELIEPLKYQLELTFDFKTIEQKERASELRKQIKEVNNKIETAEENLLLGKASDLIFEKFKAKYLKELQSFEGELKLTEKKLSNLKIFIDDSVKLVNNLPLLWQKGNLASRRKLQKLVYPNGIAYDKETHSYRTYVMNAFVELIGSLSMFFIEKKKGQTNGNIDLSLLVLSTIQISNLFFEDLEILCRLIA